MANLGDYIGKLLSEITIARANADIESVRVAEMYNSHPLLRNFPVPRVRLPKIELTVPVMISDVEEDEQDVSSRDKVDDKTLVLTAEKSILEEVKKYGVKLNSRELASLRVALKKKSKEIKPLREKAISMGAISRTMSAEAVKSIVGFGSAKNKISGENIKKLSGGIDARIKDDLLGTRKPAPRIKVSALTSQLKEVAPERLVYFKLSLEEDALEWTSIEEDGEQRDILTSE